MEQSKHKLKARASCDGEGVHIQTESLVDILSNLPDQVAHCILSFLTITDLTRFGCVSKRCRELYLSTPSLDFDGFSLENTSTCYHRLKLLNYLDRFFYQRGDNKIQCFRVRWLEHNVDFDNDDEGPCFCVNENYRIFSWIQKAVRCKVETLDLEMALYSYEVEVFPSCVFLCESLRSLVVSRTILKTPPCAFSSNLKHLELCHVHIKDDEGFFKWISCSCKCIEELSLRQVSGIETVNIKISSLKKFSFFAVGVMDRCHIDISAEKIEDILIACRFESPSNKFFNIHAPNLKSIKWAGNLMNHTNLGKLEFLNNAGISFEPEDDLDSGFDVLCSLCRAKFLVLNEVAIKAAFREGSTQAPLFDTCRLHLRIGNFDVELVPAMVSLFRRMHHLFDLTIVADPPVDDPKSDTFGFNVEWWKLQKLAYINKLKQVTIGLCDGSNGMELAKYVLECAQNLQKMVIIYLPQDLEKVTIQLKECKKISKAQVFILDKETREQKRVRISKP